MVEPNVFLHFIGNPRSGTTLVRSLLNAHPAIVISQEENVVNSFLSGERSWNYLCGTMLDNAERFDADPAWNSYSYDIAFGAENDPFALTVIGDKKSMNTAAKFGQHPELLGQILNWCPIPLQFVHCVRNPLDVIATKGRNNNMSIEWNIERYFELEDTATLTQNKLLANEFHQLYLDDLIADPNEALVQLLDFLGVETIPDHVSACSKWIFDKPHKSRNSVEWTDEQLVIVQAGIMERKHLHRYHKLSGTSET